MDKKLNKYIAAIVYFDKTLVSLSATSGRVYIISFVSVIRAPVGIASASFILVFSLTTRIIEKLLSIIKKKKKKHNKIFMLTKSKLNSIETLISQTIINEKEKYEKMKEIIRMMEANDGLIVNNKKLEKIMEIHRIKKIIFF